MLDAVRWGPKLPGPARQLVVICHGVGARGHNLIVFAPGLADGVPHAAFAAPHAPLPYDHDPALRQWWSIGDRNPARIEREAAAARPALDAFVDAELARLALPPGAYALVGFSQGAMMVLYDGLRRAPPPRGIVAYAGRLVAPDHLAAERVNASPVLLVHGEADGVVLPQESCRAEWVLRAAGVPVSRVFLPGVGHGIDGAGSAVGARFLQQCFADL